MYVVFGGSTPTNLARKWPRFLQLLGSRETGKVEASTRVDGNPVSQDLFKVPVRAHALKERSSDILRPFIIRF